MASSRLLRSLTSAALGLGTLVAVTASSTAFSAPAGATVPSCPLSALAKAKGPVDITFWESFSRANETTIQNLTNTFNASQSKVHVNLLQQNTYDDTWEKYEAGLSNGQLPAVALLEDQRTQAAIDTDSFLPVQACMNATHYQTGDFLARALAYYKVNGVQWAMPFAESNPIVYYNKQAFTKAGLNPNDPPATLPQFLADAAALKAHGSGTGLVLDPWHLETWLATANQLFVNNHNGRTGRATKGVFDTPVGVQIFTELDHLVRSGDATTNPATGPEEYDNLLGVGNGKFGMTIDTSAALGTITQVLDSGQYPNVSLGVGAFPVLSASLRGGIEPGGSGVYISKKVPAAEQAAAWQYVSFLMSTSSQATWGAGTGYIPVRKSSTQTALMQHLWVTNPGYKVAYQQAIAGVNTYATSGSIIGPYENVRNSLLAAEESMYQQGVSPKQALKTAEQQVNSDISSYNQQLGVS